MLEVKIIQKIIFRYGKKIHDKKLRCKIFHDIYEKNYDLEKICTKNYDTVFFTI